tara:strand:+ start:3479 stop:4729 length:1251 start_codon:yes stop_codon:yes gene_type:complete
MKYQSIRGTHDLLPNETPIWRLIENLIHSFMKKYAFHEIRTPIFENTDLFIRAVGKETDIVTKEMYSWIDQGGSSLTLRPELTAPVIRAYLQHNLGSINKITKLYYIDSLFRRERPQKGRQRQFNQFGVEAIGSSYPEQDAEIISLAYKMLNRFDVGDMLVKINSIGSSEIRQSYIKNLIDKLEPIKKNLCKTCNNRLSKNPLRLFDCKNSQCQELLDLHAPLISSNLTKQDEIHFNEVLHLLDLLKISYVHDKKLVRGLDYYTRTTFEITSSKLGAQNTICGGGRYDILVEQMGGKPTPAIGFAMGIERLIIAMNNNKVVDEKLDVYIVLLGGNAIEIGIKIAEDLRIKYNKKVILETMRRSLKSQMKDANNKNAIYTIIIGENEIKSNQFIIKEMSSGKQSNVTLEGILGFFKE